MWYETTGNAKFMHVTPAAAAIMDSQKLLGAKGGSAGGKNSKTAALNCKGYVYLWPCPHDISGSNFGDSLIEKAIWARKDVRRTMKEASMAEGDNEKPTLPLKVILIDVGAGFKVEYDPDQSNALRHKGDIEAGGSISLSVVDIPCEGNLVNDKTPCSSFAEGQPLHNECWNRRHRGEGAADGKRIIYAIDVCPECGECTAVAEEDTKSAKKNAAEKSVGALQKLHWGILLPVVPFCIAIFLLAQHCRKSSTSNSKYHLLFEDEI